MTHPKIFLQTLLIIAIRGKRGGISWFGSSLERLAQYIVFIVRSARMNARFATLSEAPQESQKPLPADGLVYDIGANNGDDTEYYLAKGLRVVAVEANPTLANHITKRFSSEIAEGQLTVLTVAITDTEADDVEFFIHEENDKISTAVAPDRDKDAYRKVLVPARRLPDLIAEYGTPLYVKIDIEGMDQYILRDLFSAEITPAFISAEAHSIEVLCQFVVAGYKRFKIVEGKYVHSPYYNIPVCTTSGELIRFRFQAHSSAPFCDDIPGAWETTDFIFTYLQEYGLGWKDIHAAR